MSHAHDHKEFYEEAMKCPYVKKVTEKCPFIKDQVQSCPFLKAEHDKNTEEDVLPPLTASVDQSGFMVPSIEILDKKD